MNILPMFFKILVITLFFGSFVFQPLIGAGEPPTDILLARARELQAENREKDALSLYEQVLRTEPNHFSALLASAYLHIRQGWLTLDEAEEKVHYQMALNHAERALYLKPDDYQANLLNCVAKAKCIDYAFQGDQVRIVRELEQKLNALIASNRLDPDSIYILSWLNFKVGGLSVFKKFMVSVLFGGLPKDFSQEKAIRLMERSIELKPDYIVYHYDLGHFYQRMRQIEKARMIFKKAASMPPHKPEDTIYKQFAECRLRGLSGDPTKNAYKCR